jgi:hypothetical protein
LLKFMDSSFKEQQKAAKQFRIVNNLWHKRGSGQTAPQYTCSWFVLSSERLQFSQPSRAITTPVDRGEAAARKSAGAIRYDKATSADNFGNRQGRSVIVAVKARADRRFVVGGSHIGHRRRLPPDRQSPLGEQSGRPQVGTEPIQAAVAAITLWKALGSRCHAS